MDPGRQHRDPVLLRPAKKTGSKGPLLMGAGGLLFVAYIYNSFGVASSIDGFFGGLDQTAHAHEAEVVDWYLRVLPALGVLVLVALGWVLIARSALGRKRKKTRVVEAGGSCTIHEFAELCREAGIGAKVARESYRLLLVRQRERLRHILTADLEVDLGMTPAAVVAFYAELLRKTDRPASESRATPFKTLQDVLQAVEFREDLSLAEGRLTGRVADLRREMAERRPRVARMPEQGE